MRIAIFLLLSCVAAASAAAQQTENVVLVTADGLRHQELFGGVDPVLLESAERAGIADPDALRSEYWRDDPVERRETLMPFFWSELAPSGVVMRARIGNPQRVSYPGYAELLVGRVVPEITGNIDVQNPAETVLEIARRELSLGRTQVAVFTAWDHFAYIVESRPGSIFVNAGSTPIPRSLATLEMERLNELQERVPSPWESVRYNGFTVAQAEAYLKAYAPRLVYIALDETDEWAHARRYDLTVRAVRSVDAELRRLWSTLQSLDSYREKTTLIVTTDHGRGRTLDDWTSHGSDVEGATETWIAVYGPDTRAQGVIEGTFEHDRIAATVLALLGVDPGVLGPEAGAPIPPALP